MPNLTIFLINALVFYQGLLYAPLVFAQEATESAVLEKTPAVSEAPPASGNIFTAVASFIGALLSLFATLFGKKLGE